MNLWLDDVRDPTKFGCVGWVWVTTAQSAIDILSTGVVDRASLDHDLTENATLGLYDEALTGYDVVVWMEEHNIWPPRGVTVHSMNPVGKHRMEKVIRRHYKN